MILLGDSNQILKDINDESIDLLLTDPPYGIEFMGKDWDKAVVPTETWKECYRVLKNGKLAFIMCSPRQDVLSRMIVNLQDAGFRTNYSSIYWTFASGFPKAANVSKLLDKKNGRYFDTRVKDYLNQKRKDKGLSFGQVNEYLGMATNGGGVASSLMGDKPDNQLPTFEVYIQLKNLLELDDRFDELIQTEEAEREVIGQGKAGLTKGSGHTVKLTGTEIFDITKPATEEAKKMEGAYVGFQPKPAVEIILVVSKGKTLTWLDDCRIPYQSEDDKESSVFSPTRTNYREWTEKSGYDVIKKELPEVNPPNEKGRFPANLLVQNNILDNGEEYSRYFSLDAWPPSTFPFIITPKASKAERNAGVDSEPIKVNDGRNTPIDNPFQRGETLRTNSHPTVKPIKLMSYLITLGSREGDIILDPFAGSGTTLIAAHQLHRKFIGIEINEDYLKIAKERLTPHIQQRRLLQFI